MNDELLNLQYIIDEIDDLPGPIRTKVVDIAGQLRELIKGSGPEAMLALALVGAEASAGLLQG